MKSNKFYSLYTIAAVLLAMLFSVQHAHAHWSTRGPYGGTVHSFTLIDSTVYLGSPTGGVYRSANAQFTAWVYRNYNGLGSGKVTALASVGKVVIAGTADSGVYISNNLGINWTKKSNGLINQHILSLAGDGGKLYAGTAGGGVFVSSDTGTTWVAQSTGLGGLTVNALLAKGDTLIAGTAGSGVYASVSGGTLWFALNNGLTDLNITSLAYSGSTAFIGTPSGVFSGSLTAFVWTLTNTGLGNTHINDLIIKADTVYAATDAGVYYSLLSAVSWSAAGSFTDTVNALVAYGANILAGTNTGGIYKSAIGTFTWSAVNSGFNNRQSYAAAARDSLVLVANELGVFVCKNFVQSPVYVQSNNGLEDSFHVQALQIGAGKLFAGTTNGIYVSTDTGTSWAAANNGLTSLNVIKLLATDTKLYAVTSDGKIFSSLLSSVSWTVKIDDLPVGFNITSIVNIGDTIAIGCEAGVYISVGGAFWAALYPFHHSVTALAAMDRALYIGTDTAGVFKTAFGSGIFTAVNAGLPDLNIQALSAVDKFILVGYKGGAKASCNGAKTWHDFGILEYIPNYSDILGFVDITPRIFALVPQHGLLGNSKAEFPEAAPEQPAAIALPAGICSGAAVTLSVTDDTEETAYQWTLPNGWAGTSATNSITVTPALGNDTVRVAALNGCGISQEQKAQVTVGVCSGIEETEASHVSVYPNPFRNELVIKAGKMDGDAIAYLQDITGKTIAAEALVSQSVSINTSSLAKGIYLLRILENGKLIAASKVVKQE
jgi:hypothetical protein